MIPKHISVGRNKYAVSVVERISATTVGHIDYGRKHISISTRNPRTKKAVPLKQQTHTFWHEMTHAILKDMGHSLESNEKFVDEFARRLNNAIYSAKF